MTAGVVEVPFSTQLLTAAVLLQFAAFAAVFWRAILGRQETFHQRPRWPLIPLVLGTIAGAWYAVDQLDLVMGVAQALALFIGYRLIMGHRPPPQEAPQGSRRERREAAREAKRKKREQAGG
jgi:hypothetical protein